MALSQPPTRGYASSISNSPAIGGQLSTPDPTATCTLLHAVTSARIRACRDREHAPVASIAVSTGCVHPPFDGHPNPPVGCSHTPESLG